MNLKVSDAKREEGFTLIELLVVVIIIGILAAIAIPVFLNQRAQAWERTAQSDARNAAIALESYFNDEFEYPDNAELGDGDTISGTPVTLDTGEVITPSPSVTMTYVLGTGDEDGQFAICVQHDNLDEGTGVVAVYDSGAGGVLPDVNRNDPGAIADCAPGFDWSA